MSHPTCGDCFLTTAGDKRTPVVDKHLPSRQCRWGVASSSSHSHLTSLPQYCSCQKHGLLVCVCVCACLTLTLAYVARPEPLDNNNIKIKSGHQRRTVDRSPPHSLQYTEVTDTCTVLQPWLSGLSGEFHSYSGAPGNESARLKIPFFFWKTDSRLLL